MKFLLIGDVFGESGIRALKNELPLLKKKNNIDFVIANCENVTKCRGLSLSDYNTINELGVNFITMGNHTWKHGDIRYVLEKPNIIRPANVYTNSLDKMGVGYKVINVKDKKIKIINLLGNLQYFNIGKIKNPFNCLDEILNNSENVDITILDFHAETTSEKNCMLRAFCKSVQIIVGTHTHVQTNDAQIYNETAYITDLGLTGPLNGVIGAKKESLINMFTGINKQFRLEEESGAYQFSGVIVEIDDKTNKPIKIENVLIKEQNEE